MIVHQHVCLVIVTTACSLVACEPNSPRAQPPNPSAQPRPSAAKTDPQPAPSVSAAASASSAPCEALRKRFGERLAAASNACKTAADCTCSPGGINPAGCGQVVDRESAKELYSLYNQFRTDCGLDRHCAPRRCRVKCTNSYCREDHDAADHHPQPITPLPPSQR
ncbi:MAG: hypothetical protein DRI90_22630 [Deltaproteobacteria bacterium]|nr:MAG: hypothetical protein DRI90_22630 [Deltaproteobacteria bacterium]